MLIYYTNTISNKINRQGFSIKILLAVTSRVQVILFANNCPWVMKRVIKTG